MGPTSKQDRALLNNLRMTDSKVAAGSPVAFFVSVAASTPVPQPFQNALPVRGSFRPPRPEYLTRFERTHFHVHNMTSERPCLAFFNIQDPAIRTREVSEALLRERIPANGVRCVQRSPNEGVDIAFQTVVYRDKFLRLASLFERRTKTTSLILRGIRLLLWRSTTLPVRCLIQLFIIALENTALFFPSVVANSMIFQEFLTAYGTYEWTFISLSFHFWGLGGFVFVFTTMVSRRLAEDVTLWIILAETVILLFV